MASSNVARWRIGCDHCAVSAMVGPAAQGTDLWCESCQTAYPGFVSSAVAPRCARCDAALTPEPRFVELWGELQHLDAVLSAWAGDPEPLATLLPERPRFLTDLDPPREAAGDPPAVAACIAAALHGGYRELAAMPAADVPDDARAHAARAIALERTGDPGSALAEWDAVLATPDLASDAVTRAHLARGSLLARAGRFEAAASDLDRAGSSFAARWNRASLLVHASVSMAGELPGPEVLARARAEAGEASAYWSDHTVGRLLWSLLVERALATRGHALAPVADPVLAMLRAAEREFEHGTFWDRAMMLVGWARLGAAADAARIAGPLAREVSAGLLDEPALRGEALAAVAREVVEARTAMDMGDPGEARHALAAALAREDLRRFRIPCATCGEGTIGVEETIDRDA